MSKGQSQQTAHFVKRVLGKCKNKSSTESVEIFDVDDEKTDVYTINNKSGSSCQEPRCYSWKTRNRCTASVIYIDEEDSDADDTLPNICSTSKHAYSMDGQSDGIDCHNGPQMGSKPVKKDTMHAECSSRNRYGLNDDTSSDSSEYSSESDDSDCEIIEDISENIRKQWEKAATRRRTPQSDQSHNIDDHSTAPPSSTAPGFTSEGPTKDKGDVDYCMKENYQPFSKILEEAFDESRSSSLHSGYKLSSTINYKNTVNEDSCLGKCKSYSTNGYPCSGVDGENFDFGDKDKSTPEKCSQHDHISVDSHCNQNDVTFSNIERQEAFTGVQSSDQPSFSGAQSDSDKERSYHETMRKEKGHNEQPSGPSCLPDDSVFGYETTAGVKVCQFSEEILFNNVVDEVQIKVRSECFLGDKKVNMEETACNSNERDGPIGVNHSLNYEPQSRPFPRSDLIDDTENHSRNDNLPQIQDGLLGDREKHKDSNEYRRAEEVEWAARHRELQIQAEEIQRQKRRRKAETLRLLDMERRQKQRLEEIRESQKKDEEIINIKEHLRAEVRKELDKVERRYRDMASLLRGLGIDVKGGPYPLTHEINAAYKQALLRFHPDRASRTDIREQVEAEEKFKLISRLKEKLLPLV